MIYSDIVTKINMWGMKQERILLMTTKNIFNFKKKKIKRKIPIEKIKGVIKSTKDEAEIVLHIPSEYDYRYKIGEREEFFKML